MEIHPPFNFTTLILVSSFIFSLIKLLKNLNKPQSKPEHLPLSPPKLPVIGHLHHLLGAGLPHHPLTEIARQYGPVLLLHLGQVPTVVISFREAARQVLKIHDPACADRPESIGTRIMWYDHADLIFSPYEWWKQMRKICILEVLSTKNVRSFGSIRQEEAGHLIGSLRLSTGRPVNLTEKVFAFTSSILCRVAFGKAVVGDRQELVVLLRKAVAKASGFEAADFFPGFKIIHVLSWNRYRLMRMRRKLDGFLDGILEQHRVKRSGEFGGEDIVDVLLRMHDNGELRFPITYHNIKAIIFDIFSAGTETSSNVLDWTMAELMRNPHVMSKAQAEIRDAFKRKTTIEEGDVQALSYLKLVIKETLRLHPPLPLLPRACREECTVDGYTIPVKSRVMVNIWSMGRDPQYWAEPETFWPERFEDGSVDFLGNNFEFIPFGAGKRICPGINFGLVNIEMPLAQLLYYFDWKLPQGMSIDDVDMTEAEGLAVNRKNDLFLIPLVHGTSFGD